MKKSVFVLIAAIAIAFSTMSFTPAHSPSGLLWVTHTDSIGFKIDFPATPTRTKLSSTDPMVINKIKLEQVTSGSPRFILLFEDKTSPYVNVNRVLNDMVDAHSSKLGGTVIFRDIPRAWKGGTQVTAKIENTAGVKCNIRSYVKGNQSFVMIVENNTTYAPIADVTNFWNSLK